MGGSNGKTRCSMNSYRLWLYGGNVFLLCTVCAFLLVARTALNEPRMTLIPLDDREPLVLALYIGPVLQAVDVLVCFCGLWRNRVRLVFAYWAFLFVLLVFDFVMAVLWVFRWRALHKNVSAYISTVLTQQYDNDRVCLLWDAVQSEYACCGVTGYRDWLAVPSWCGRRLGGGNATRLPQSCCDNDEYAAFCYFNASASHATDADADATTPAPFGDGCFDDVLQWMHNRCGNFLFVGFCFVIFAKIVLLIILRAEIREFTYEVDAAQHRESICAARTFSVDRTPYGEEAASLRRSEEKISSASA